MLGLLAKAKGIGTAEWIEGYYVFQYGAHQIYLPNGTDDIGFDYYCIDLATLCLYTGKTDINNNKIFSKDIVFSEEFNSKGVVFYSNDDAAFCVKMESGSEYFLFYFETLKVVGNSVDNPEMMEEMKWKC